MRVSSASRPRRRLGQRVKSPACSRRKRRCPASLNPRATPRDEPPETRTRRTTEGKNRHPDAHTPSSHDLTSSHLLLRWFRFSLAWFACLLVARLRRPTAAGTLSHPQSQGELAPTTRRRRHAPYSVTPDRITHTEGDDDRVAERELVDDSDDDSSTLSRCRTAVTPKMLT